MGFWKKTGNAASQIVDVRVDKWVGYEYNKELFQKTTNFAKGFFIPKQAMYQETYEEALARMNLTEEDMTQRKKEFIRLTIAFISIALGLFIYSMVATYRASYATAAVTFCLTFYALAQAFKFHFWYFQIKNRKLGCTFHEWLNSKVSAD